MWFIISTLVATGATGNSSRILSLVRHWAEVLVLGYGVAEWQHILIGQS